MLAPGDKSIQAETFDCDDPEGKHHGQSKALASSNPDVTTVGQPSRSELVDALEGRPVVEPGGPTDICSPW